MQARFVSLRVAETWEMVERRHVSAVPPIAALTTAVDLQPSEPQPRDLEPTPAHEPFPVD
jgi:hypothetical protein